jgi:hypothetical protein
MRKAFYSQPTLWNLITSAIQGKNPKGTGIGPAMDIINKYKVAKFRKNLGDNFDNFKQNKDLKYFVVDNIVLNPTGKPEDELVFSVNKDYTANVQPINFDDETLTLVDKINKVEIRVNSKVRNIKDGYNVSFIKKIKNDKTNDFDEYAVNGQIKIINKQGSGYFNDYNKQFVKPKTNKPINQITP